MGKDRDHEVEVQIEFVDMDLSGDIGSSDVSRNGVYRIRINKDKPKIKQVRTLVHELTHMISDLFYGILDLRIPEEDLCDKVEEAYINEFKKHLRMWGTKHVKTKKVAEQKVKSS